MRHFEIAFLLYIGVQKRSLNAKHTWKVGTITWQNYCGATPSVESSPFYYTEDMSYIYIPLVARYAFTANTKTTDSILGIMNVSVPKTCCYMQMFRAKTDGIAATTEAWFTINGNNISVTGGWYVADCTLHFATNGIIPIGSLT